MLPGAVQPHRQVVPCHPEIGRDIPYLIPLEIHPLQKHPVLPGHQWQEPFEALTQYPFLFPGRILRQFFFELRERASFRFLPTINIDDRTPQDTVEPLRYFLLLLRLALGGKRFNQTFLNDIFRKMRISHPLARESHKHSQILEQCVFKGHGRP